MQIVLEDFFSAPTHPRPQREEFYGFFSHLFRTPSVAACGYLDYLFKGYAGRLTRDQSVQLGYARRATLQLMKIIDCLLDVIAFDLDLKRPNLQDVKLTEFIREAADDFAQAGRARLQLTPRARGMAAPIVRVDPDWLRKVLFDLALNPLMGLSARSLTLALFADRDALVLQVGGKKPRPPRGYADYLLTLLSDSNPARGRRRFSRRQRDILGVALAYRMVRAMRGRLWIQKQTGGLAVYIELPRPARGLGPRRTKRVASR